MEAEILNTERMLLRRVAKGDEQAFNQLYNQYWTITYNYLLRMVKTPQVAEEIATDIFLKLWTGKELVLAIDNLGGFLRIVARNQSINYLKLVARQQKLQQLYKRDMVQWAAPAADTTLLDAETTQLVKEAVAQLTPQRRKVFLLHRTEGMSYEQIAAALQISPHTVKSTMAKALQSMRVFLSKKEGEGISALWVFFHL